MSYFSRLYITGFGRDDAIMMDILLHLLRVIFCRRAAITRALLFFLPVKPSPFISCHGSFHSRIRVFDMSDYRDFRFPSLYNTRGRIFIYAICDAIIFRMSLIFKATCIIRYGIYNDDWFCTNFKNMLAILLTPPQPHFSVKCLVLLPSRSRLPTAVFDRPRAFHWRRLTNDFWYANMPMDIRALPISLLPRKRYAWWLCVRFSPHRDITCFSSGSHSARFPFYFKVNGRTMILIFSLPMTLQATIPVRRANAARYFHAVTPRIDCGSPRARGKPGARIGAARRFIDDDLRVLGSISPHASPFFPDFGMPTRMAQPDDMSARYTVRRVHGQADIEMRTWFLSKPVLAFRDIYGCFFPSRRASQDSRKLHDFASIFNIF